MPVISPPTTEAIGPVRSMTTNDRAEAFRLLFDANHADIAAYCARRGTEALANDAVSETFLVAWRRFDEIPAGPQARLWLYGTARRALSNLRRSEARTIELHDRIAAETAATNVHVASIDLSDQVVGHPTPVLEALATLNPDDQELLRLITWEDLSHAEAAHVLGCSTNALGVRLLRARRRLADAMTKDQA